MRSGWLPKAPFRKAMVLSIFTVVALSLIQLLIVYPRFSQLAVNDCAHEALRAAGARRVNVLTLARVAYDERPHI